MAQDSRAIAEDEEPPRLRRLRLMVSALIVVLIAGVLTVVAALVIKLGALAPAPSASGPIAAAELRLPAGEDIVTVGEGGGGVLVVTRDAGGAERLRKFDPGSGALISETPIRRD